MTSAAIKNSFASDNIASACPAIMQALVEANNGIASSYGADQYTGQLQDQLSTLFETDLRVFPVISGTAANALALSALTPAYGKVFCHQIAHINTDECGAPEFFTAGAKLIPINSANGKISPQQLTAHLRGAGDVHSAQPATLSITQAIETGRVYNLDEISALSTLAKAHQLKLHMDGARFANALVSLNASPAEMTWKAGVDVLSFGGTKNGCLAAEAVVFFNPKQAENFEYLHKRSGQLISKMRFISAQLLAYIDDDLWLRNARNANATALTLATGLAAIPGIKLAYPVEANEVFAHIPAELLARVNASGYAIPATELDGSAPSRFVTAWNSSEQEVALLLEALRAAV